MQMLACKKAKSTEVFKVADIKLVKLGHVSISMLNLAYSYGQMAPCCCKLNTLKEDLIIIVCQKKQWRSIIWRFTCKRCLGCLFALALWISGVHVDSANASKLKALIIHITYSPHISKLVIDKHRSVALGEQKLSKRRAVISYQRWLRQTSN